jgi:hypothetical protein
MKARWADVTEAFVPARVYGYEYAETGELAVGSRLIRRSSATEANRLIRAELIESPVKNRPE